MRLIKNIVDWRLAKEVKMTNSCSIPMREIAYELNDVSQKLEKIKSIKLLRYAK